MEKFGEIINSTTPVLVDFFATWCGPCKMMHPRLEELAGRVQGKARIIKIDIDKNRELAEQYGIRSVPTLIIFKNGDVKFRTAGVQSVDDLQAELEKYY